MNTLDLQEFNTSDLLCEKRIIEEQFEQAGISLERGIELISGEKYTYNSWKDIDLPSIHAIKGDYAIRTGNGLIVFDVDDWDSLSVHLQRFLLENPTMVVQSPHSEGKDGHYYFATDSDLNKNPSGVDIQGEGSIIVGPGSKLTDCKHGCCTSHTPGEYTIKHNRPIAHIEQNTIEELVSEEQDKSETNQEIELEDLPEVNQDLVEEGLEALRQYQGLATKAFDCIHDRLKGGKGHFDEKLKKDNGKIDRSRQDFLTIEHLYGLMLFIGINKEKAKELAYATYCHYCNEYEYTKDGQLRKWLEIDETYRRKMLTNAIEQYNSHEFERFSNKTNDTNTSYRRENNKYSEITIRIAQFSCELLSGEFETVEEITSIARAYGFTLDSEQLETVLQYNPHYHDNTPPMERGVEIENSTGEVLYPTKSEVIDLATRIDRNGEDTFQRVLNDLRKRGLLKMACVKEGVRYVYYPYDYKDPEAEYIKHEGERYEL